jgi:hypothetical protein
MSLSILLAGDTSPVVSFRGDSYVIPRWTYTVARPIPGLPSPSTRQRGVGFSPTARRGLLSHSEARASLRQRGMGFSPTARHGLLSDSEAGLLSHRTERRSVSASCAGSAEGVWETAAFFDRREIASAATWEGRIPRALPRLSHLRGPRGAFPTAGVGARYALADDDPRRGSLGAVEGRRPQGGVCSGSAGAAMR